MPSFRVLAHIQGGTHKPEQPLSSFQKDSCKTSCDNNMVRHVLLKLEANKPGWEAAKIGRDKRDRDSAQENAYTSFHNMSSSDSTPKSPPEECMSCRIISTATLGGTGSMYGGLRAQERLDRCSE
ncbi:hypothetical protein M422DRAFT_243471 [Sphaerobolus stellatus SS14]|nr:hypothetical protein M422DRAFT_243471 [Sphaerobolus stellatus SS14]